MANTKVYIVPLRCSIILTILLFLRGFSKYVLTPLISDSNNLQVGKCIMYVDTTGQIKVSSLQWKGDKCVFLFLLQEFQEYDHHYFCLQVLVLPNKNKKNRFFSQKQVQVIMLFPIFYSPVHYKKRTPEFVLKISIYEFVTLIRGL